MYQDILKFQRIYATLGLNISNVLNHSNNLSKYNTTTTTEHENGLTDFNETYFTQYGLGRLFNVFVEFKF